MRAEKCVSDKDAPEKLTVTLAEAKAGLRLTRRRVVLTISDTQGGAPGGKKTITGTFHAGSHVIEGATFRLHKDRGDGPLLTPENLDGKTDLTWAADHWVTGADGKYKFSDLPAGKYFVELFGKPEADA
jgi:hypothetical protein